MLVIAHCGGMLSSAKHFTGPDIICVSVIACCGGMLFSAKPFTHPDIICMLVIACCNYMLSSVKPFMGPDIICVLVVVVACYLQHYRRERCVARHTTSSLREESRHKQWLRSP
jgi:hypothetical protein